MYKIKDVPMHQRIKTMMPGDKDWFISTDNITITPRASFQVIQGCPPEYATIIHEAIRVGWLKPVAHMKTSEYIWEQLGE